MKKLLPILFLLPTMCLGQYNPKTGRVPAGTSTGQVPRWDGSKFLTTGLVCADLGNAGSLCTSSGPLPSNEAGASNNFLTAYNSGTGAFSKARPTWANIDKTISSLADLTTRACSNLSDSGSLCTSSGPLPSNEAGAANNFLTAYNSGTGAFSKAQPSCGNLSDAGTGCSGAAYPGLPRLDQVLDPNAAKTFNLGGNTLTFDSTAVAGGIHFRSLGGGSGHLFEILQNTGNPSAGTHLLHVEAVDDDVVEAHFVHTSNQASHQVMILENERSSPANNDEVYVSADLHNSAAAEKEFARVSFRGTDVTSTSEDASFIVSLIKAGSLTDALTVDSLGTAKAAASVNAVSGFQVNGAATSGRYLKGNGTDFVASSGSASGIGTCTNQFPRTLNSDAAPTCASVVEADLSLSNNTTANVSTTAHGLAPILPNDAAKFLNGVGGYTTPTASLPSGLIVFIDSGTCPAGFTEVAGLNGKFILGTTAAAGGVGTTGGSSSYTPAGTNGTSAVSGIVVDNHADHTHNYTQVPNHVHVQSLPSSQTGSQSSGTRDTSTTGSSADALSTANPTGGVATAVTLGSNSTLTHNVSNNGTAAAQTFTGTPATITPPYIKLIGCKSN